MRTSDEKLTQASVGARIYVASSWRNAHQPEVVEYLRGLGCVVYDFRNPMPGNDGFHWSEIDPDWESWSVAEYAEGLQHDLAVKGLQLDFDAMRWAEAFVLVQPCGRSAHLELGWALGAGKRAAVYFPPSSNVEPELMTGLADVITGDREVLKHWISTVVVGRCCGNGSGSEETR